MARQTHTVPWRRWCDLDAFAQVLGYFRMDDRYPEFSGCRQYFLLVERGMEDVPDQPVPAPEG